MPTVTKSRVAHAARKFGADVIGFAPVSRWAEYGEVKPDYRPDAIWKPAKTVIVMGVPTLLPIVESTPSINYTVLYDTSNVLLDQMAYQLSVWLNNAGAASVPMPRDGYGTRIRMQQEILRIWEDRKITMILVTHDIEEAVFLADRVVILSSRPGSIKRVVPIALPRPRERSSSHFALVRKTIYTEFFNVEESPVKGGTKGDHWGGVKGSQC